VREILIALFRDEGELYINGTVTSGTTTTLELNGKNSTTTSGALILSCCRVRLFLAEMEDAGASELILYTLGK